MENTTTTSRTLDSKQLERIAYILRAVAHPVRLRIVRMLDKQPRLMASEICQRLDLEQSLTSHHLQNLRSKGIIEAEKQGRKMLYSLRQRSVLQVIRCMEVCPAIQ